jgi:hypothetical protein
MMRKNLYLVLLFLALSSCKISGSFRGLYSYFKKEFKMQPDLYVFPNDGMNYCTETEKYIDKVLVLNGLQLKECIQNNEKSIVYYWKPSCGSEICIPIYAVDQYCQENGIALYVVSEYYHNKIMAKESYANYPIVGIDTEYYRTNLTSKYIPKFYSDLGVENITGNFFLFKNSKLVKQATGLGFQDLKYQ